MVTSSAGSLLVTVLSASMFVSKRDIEIAYVGVQD
jgi:hypothetical protein